MNDILKEEPLIKKRLAHNSGKGKYVEFSKGNPIECKKHGIHLEWYLKGNVLKCKHCISNYLKNSRNKIENRMTYLFRGVKRRQKDKNYECNITKQDIFDLYLSQDKKCALTKIEFTNEIIPSIDRIDSNKGYTKDNIQLIIFDVNRMKSNFDLKYFLNICNLISKNNCNKL